MFSNQYKMATFIKIISMVSTVTQYLSKHYTSIIMKNKKTCLECRRRPAAWAQRYPPKDHNTCNNRSMKYCITLAATFVKITKWINYVSGRETRQCLHIDSQCHKWCMQVVGATTPGDNCNISAGYSFLWIAPVFYAFECGDGCAVQFLCINEDMSSLTIASKQ